MAHRPSILTGAILLMAACSEQPTDAGLSAESRASHGRSASVTALVVSPDSVPVAVGAFQQFAATDQYGLAVPGVSWSVDGGGTIDRDGVFVATSAGAFRVTARHADLVDHTMVRVFDTGSGLVGYWDMDEASVTRPTLHDRSGSGNDGIIEGAVLAAGLSGEALAFDGEDDHVWIPDTPSLRPQALTLAAWVNPETSLNHSLISKRRSGFLDSYTLRLAAGAPELCLEPITQSCLRSQGSFVPEAEWSHVAATWDGFTMLMYRNGVPDPATTVHSVASEYSGFPVLLGTEDQDGTPRMFFKGRLDDVRIYRRALSDDEIVALYRAPLQEIDRQHGKGLGGGPPGACSGPGILVGCQPDGGAFLNPNEPPGFTRIAEHELGCVPAAESCVPVDGEWRNDGSTNLIAVSSSTGSDVLESVLQIRFPAGLEDGGEPARFDGWGPSISHQGEHGYGQIYVSLWMKIAGPSFENQTVGTKILYLAHGSTGRLNHSWLQLRGVGHQQVVAEMPLHLFISEMNTDGTDPGGAAVFHSPNVRDVPLTVGEWHRIEVWMKINDVDPTVANGEVKWWLDGILLAHHTGKRFRSDLNPERFYHLQVTPVYGGNSGDVRTRDDYWLLEHIYVSGLRP